MGALTAISLFSGCGGFDLGATQAGVEIIWANDIDQHAAKAYKQLLPNIPFVQKDIRKVKEIPKADILIGCYPCTGFSIAARRRWKERKERDLKNAEGNFLYEEFIKVLESTKPKYFFVENVNGMVSAVSGWFFQQQLQGFRDCGYTPKMKLLSAPDFGVPQSRKRVFIVGVRSDINQDFQYNFPAPTHGPNADKSFVTMEDVIKGMELWPAGEFLEQAFHGHYLTRNRKRGWKDLSYTIVANMDHVPLHPQGEPMVYVAKDKWALQGDFNRRLSWRECARIQGLPDDRFPEEPLVSLYRVIGNAVPPAFGNALLRPVVEFES
jgi:DNA (cytosine-5)-methyltransferase 1